MNYSDSPINDSSNILPHLTKKAALRIKKQIARELSASQTAKQKEESPISSDGIVKATIFDAIKHNPAKRLAIAAQSYRISRKIETAKRTTKTVVTCAETGVNISIDIPRIPGFYLSYLSPLSEVENCRKLAQRGFSYLIQLDTQVLAGILLVMADDYNLFQFSPTDNGFSKNSMLRSCGRTELINAIIFIEEKIHSQNYAFLPRLSFLRSMETKQGEFESNLQQWLKLLLTSLQSPLDTSVYDGTLEKRAFPYTRNSDVKKAEAQAKRTAKAEERALKDILSTSSKYARDLFKDSLISQVLKNYLLRTFDPITFQTVDANFKARLILKLTEIPTDNRISFIIKTLESKVKTIDLDSIDILEVPEKLTVSGSALISNGTNPVNAVKMKTVESLTNYNPDFDEVPLFAAQEQEELILEEGQIAIEYKGKKYAVAKILWESLSLIEQILYKKKLEK